MSFLADPGFPVDDAKNYPNQFLEVPDIGGHVGFVDSGNVHYNEKRALEFIQDFLIIN